MESPIVLGVDIGGSHITTALVDVREKTIIAESIRRKEVNSQDNAHAIMEAWCEAINHSFQARELTIKKIGVAMPGPFDYENGICLIEEQDKFQSLYKVNLKEELANRLKISSSTIHFINDAAGFLQGEVFAGGAEGASHVLGLTLGTGLGSSFCIRGKAIDAELWKAPFLAGMAEDYLSTKWFINRYFELSGKQLPGVKALSEVVNADGYAKQVFEEFGNNFAQFMMPIIKAQQTEVVILGGNIAQAFPIFAPKLFAILEENQFKIDIRVTKLKEHAALIGAASYCQINSH